MKKLCLKTIALTGVLLALTACNGEKPAAPSASTLPAAAEVKTSKADLSPCEVLSDDVIRRHFDTADAELTRKQSRYSDDPLCTVSWPKPNAAELEQQRAQAMSDYMTRKMRGESVERPSLRTTNEVTLTIAKTDFESAERALESFDGAMRVLSEGMTVKTDRGEMKSPTYELQPVTGVGARAMWAAGLSQLSVVTDDRIFHVGVVTGSESDQEKAKAIANDIAPSL